MHINVHIYACITINFRANVENLVNTLQINNIRCEKLATKVSDRNNILPFVRIKYIITSAEKIAVTVLVLAYFC